MDVPFSVSAFEPGALAARLIEFSHGQNQAVADKNQIQFLEAHLTSLGCRTILVEPRYTDRNFLEDYAAYYVRCFEPYSHVCTRLHFFSSEIDRHGVSKAIIADRPGDLEPHYLGFIVVKPLPLTIIGRTCLKPPVHEARRFPTVHMQEVNFYGLRLHVESLPFQEQDREVAACASSALWSVLHSTSRVFPHSMPSPVDITRAATTHARVIGRTFPNGDGLNTLQMADAIRSVGLEPFVLSVSSAVGTNCEEDEDFDLIPTSANREGAEVKARSNPQTLKLALHAYLRSGVSCVLLSAVDRRSGQESERLGGHAVAVTGYGLGRNAAEAYSESGTLFRSSRIDRIFVHDDQLGPFTELGFGEEGELEAVEEDVDGERRVSHPVNLLIPLYHKIRIPLQQIVDITVALDDALVVASNPLGLKKRFEWDIELVSLSALRDAFSASSLSDGTKLDLLTDNLPRFTWRVRAFAKDKPVFDLLFDATDLLQGRLIRRVVPYDRELCRSLAIVLPLSTETQPESLRPTIEEFGELAKQNA